MCIRDRSVGLLALGTVWTLFPMSAEALTAVSQGRRAAKAKQREAAEGTPARSLVSVKLPAVGQAFGGTAALAQYFSLSRMRIRNILRDLPFWAILALLVAFGINNGYYAGKFADRNVWPVTYLMVQAVEGSSMLFLFIVATLYACLLYTSRCV